MTERIGDIWDENKTVIRYDGLDGKMYCFSDAAKEKLLFTVDKDNNVEITVPVFVGGSAHNDYATYNADFSVLKAKGWIKNVTIKGKLELDHFGERAYIKQIEPNPYLGPESTVKIGKMGVVVEDKKQSLSYYSDGSINFNYKESGSGIGFYPNGKLQHTSSSTGRFVGYNEDGVISRIEQNSFERGRNWWLATFDEKGKPELYWEGGARSLDLKGEKIKDNSQAMRTIDMALTMAEKRTFLNMSPSPYMDGPAQDLAFPNPGQLASAQASFNNRVDSRKSRDSQQKTNRRSQNTAIAYNQGR